MVWVGLNFNPPYRLRELEVWVFPFMLILVHVPECAIILFIIYRFFYCCFVRNLGYMDIRNTYDITDRES